MGNNQGKKRQECFDEIRFVLSSFRTKYEQNEKVPKYGLNNIIETLQKNKIINWMLLDSFFQNFNRWRIDANCFMSLEISCNLNNLQLVNSCRESYILFISDTFSLEEKIKEIVIKYGFGNYIPYLLDKNIYSVKDEPEVSSSI